MVTGAIAGNISTEATTPTGNIFVEATRQEWQFPPSFNVAPTQTVPVIRTVDGQRRGSRIRWGLIPFFAKGEPGKYSTINARIETAETAASYRGPWKRG